VRAPRSGTLKSLLVADAQAVEYGEPLAIIE
jgi:biotin carboxyl carrier protein